MCGCRLASRTPTTFSPTSIGNSRSSSLSDASDHLAGDRDARVFLVTSGLCMFDPVNGSVIVWDLETVPDLRGFALANDLVGKTDEGVRAVLGNKFPKHIYHSIVCIGALVAHRENDHWTVDALGAPHVGERTEKQLIGAFCDRIAELKPQLVTFNGNTFDLEASGAHGCAALAQEHVAARPLLALQPT
jgi:hypothetical protein